MSRGMIHDKGVPELPAVTIYCERLRAYVVGRKLEKIQVVSPSLVRTFDPPYRGCVGLEVTSIRRIGKRIVLGFEDDLFYVIHLMIAGRLRWKARTFKVPRKRGLAGFTFENGLLLLTEASPKKRASLHCVRGEAALQALDPGGIEVMDCTDEEFRKAITRENRTLKRGLTDPRILSGSGNAYSDEILHQAQLSPLKRTRQLTDPEIGNLLKCLRETMTLWIERTREEVGDGFPDKVSAFKKRMAVHGKYGKPCPVCKTEVQRIRYAANECNYCPTCQTQGRLLSDRSLARLLKGDWPKTIEELEELKRSREPIDK